MMAVQQEYCLQHKNHQFNMLEMFDQLYKDEAMTDVTLMCDDGNSLKAHKIVLSSGSSYFKSIFDKLTSSNQYPIVILREISFEDLKIIVEFIYRGEVTVPHEQLDSVLKNAQWLKVKGINENSKERLCNDSGEEMNRSRKRRKRRRKRCSDPNHHDKSSENGSDENSDDFSEMDDACQTNNITNNRNMFNNENSNVNNNNNEAEIEPSRLMEQSMITVDVCIKNGKHLIKKVNFLGTRK